MYRTIIDKRNKQYKSFLYLVRDIYICAELLQTREIIAGLRVISIYMQYELSLYVQTYYRQEKQVVRVISRCTDLLQTREIGSTRHLYMYRPTTDKRNWQYESSLHVQTYYRQEKQAVRVISMSTELLQTRKIGSTSHLYMYRTTIDKRNNSRPTSHLYMQYESSLYVQNYYRREK